ncbi:hypothetical protein OIU34_18675 [Pararhizobium sp. BT-229]|uniref:HAD family hydrolase n=1 Tax=Pararhizobium sp. BT-229 TaxID=2986923 RepID=UPI0021F73E75|nr:HAD family hydrolase [Pararhizobium sp. BT-229]MCV9963905.1 hypothetical protein [Pararhizobium sp. BT-229]
MKVIHSWASAARSITREIGERKVSTLSCDVFDTLLIRTTTPDFVTDCTSRFVSELLELPLPFVAMQRNRAWTIEVSRSISNGFDAEASVHDHFLTWLRLLVGDRSDDSQLHSLATSVIAKEVEFEKACLKPNHEMERVLRAAKAQGVKVVAVSDMYLSASEIGTLLDHHGFEGLVDVVVSSADLHLQKKTGRLFGKLVETGVYGVSKKEVLHVGDDTLADGIKAFKSGLRSIVVYDWAEMAARSLTHGAGPLPSARSVSNSILRHATADNGAAGLGISRFGPIYAGFVHGLADKATELGLNSVWFLAREGWLLHELYLDSIQSGLTQKAPPSGYLYGSRLSTMRAQIETFGTSEMKAARDNTSDHSLRSILAPLGIPSEKLETILGTVSLSCDAPADDAAITALEACKPFMDAVTDIGKAELAGMREYLLRTGFPKEGRVGIVDVGWGGQIQENIERIIRRLGWRTEVFGLYLGTDHRSDARRSTGMSLAGLVSDSRAGAAPGVGAFSFVQGLELATRSQHGSVKGYSSDGFPVLAEEGRGRKAEEVDDPVIANVQLGILAYARRYFRMAAMARISSMDSIDHARDVVDILSLFPRRQDARLMLRFNNVANLGMEDGLLLGGETSIFRPRNLIRTLRTTLWQEGTCAFALPFLGPLAFLLHRKRRRMLPERAAATCDHIVEPLGSPSATVQVVADVLDLDLSSVRRARAASASRAAILPATSNLSAWGIRDVAALAAIRFIHGNGLASAKSSVKLLWNAGLRFAYKHPVAEVAKKALRKFV